MNVSTVEINLNDDLQEVIRKSNHNTTALSKAVSAPTEASASYDYIDEVRINFAKQIDTILNTIGEFRSWVQQELFVIDQKIQAVEAKTIPLVGTWIYADYDPNVKYMGTEWEEKDCDIEGARLWHRTL